MLLRRTFASRLINLNYSTAAAVDQSQATDFRTLENDPTKHETKHIGRYYKIPDNVRKQLFSYGGLPKQYEKQIKTFAEATIMVRQPAIEIINYIKENVSVEKPAVRYVLYGEDGVGKSITLSHILHYGFTAGFVLVHTPLTQYWFRNPKEFGASSTKEGFTDLPLDAVAWLMNFKAQNIHLLNNPDLKVSKDYVWSKRETTQKDAPLLELVEHGINRIKFACDAIDVLIEELKMLSTAGKCKVLAVIDGYNAFWYPLSQLRGAYRVRIKTDHVTLTKPFRSITDFNWTNGAAVMAVDPQAVVETYHESPLPKFLLGQNGFEHLDPFVPVHVPNYSDLEYRNCIDYYLDRKWIQNTTEGFDTELKFLSKKNPFTLMRMCAPL